MVDISKVKKGDIAVFNVDCKAVELEVVGVDLLMKEIYSLELQGENSFFNVIVNTKGVDILGETPLGDVYKVFKKAKKLSKL